MRDLAVGVDALGAEDRRARAGAGARPRDAAPASGRSAARRAGSSRARPAPASRIAPSSESPTTVSFAITSTCRSSPRSASRSTTTCSTGSPPAAFSIFSITCLRTQPDFSRGCVETTIDVTGGSSWASASRAASTRRRVDHEAVRRDAVLAERGQRAVEPAAGRRPARVLVHDVAAARLRDGADDRDEVRLALLQHLDQVLPGDRLVRDHEDVAQCVRTSSGTAVRSPFSTAWRAPGIAVLVRVADDLRDLVEVEDRRRRAHLPLERERAPRVVPGAAGRASSSRSCCTKKTIVEAPSANDATEMKKFQSANWSA